MDILLLGSYTRFSCFLIKRNMLRAKITILRFYTLYHIPSPPTGWTNWPINGLDVSNLNWQQFSPCHNIHIYSTSIKDSDWSSSTNSAYKKGDKSKNFWPKYPEWRHIRIFFLGINYTEKKVRRMEINLWHTGIEETIFSRHVRFFFFLILSLKTSSKIGSSAVYGKMFLVTII